MTDMPGQGLSVPERFEGSARTARPARAGPSWDLRDHRDRFDPRWSVSPAEPKFTAYRFLGAQDDSCRNDPGKELVYMRRLFTIVTAGTVAGLLCAGAMAGNAVGANTAKTSGHVTQPGGLIIRSGVAPDGTGLPTISENWSGYAAVAAKKFTFVHSTFVEPKITCPGVKNQWTSNWVGLDGFTDQTVEQDGTFAMCGGA